MSTGMPTPHAQVLSGRVAAIRPSRQTILVAVDGPGGAGKSTVANAIVAELRGAVVRSDDFYKPTLQRELADRRRIGWAYDLGRLRAQVLLPLAEDRLAKYQRYDWPSDELASPA